VQLLAPVGFDTRVAADGQQALDEFDAWQPDLILMDMRMPVVDGYEATRRIRSGRRGSDVAIIGVSASAFEEMRQGVFDAGVDDFIIKPFHERDLFGKIGALLGVRYIEDDADECDEPTASQPPVGPESSTRAATSTVLYVEDNPSNVTLMERILALRPHVALVVARTGRAGLEHALGRRPDLILMDLHLPDISGEDLLRQLRDAPRTASTPIVVLSGDTWPERRERLINAGANDFLTKPFDIADVLRLVDAATSLTR